MWIRPHTYIIASGVFGYSTPNHDSLKSGVFPSIYKSAIVTPLLKKPSLDPNDLKNYRPVSNLSFMSKFLEKIVSQLMSHLNRHKLFSSFQSAYRLGHSTETALLKVVNDLPLAMDEGKLSVLVLLDLSAAFDTLDHGILLHRLQHVFSIQGTVLSWFRSYLTKRFQIFSTQGTHSDQIELLWCTSGLCPRTHSCYSLYKTSP